MGDDVENHTLRLLQEMRQEIADMRAELTNRIDGNTLILNMIAGFVHDHEQRIEKLEAAKA